MMLILLEQRIKNPKVADGSFETPDDVLKVSKDFMESCNVMAEFISDCLEVTNDRNDTASFGDVHSKYKKWVMKNDKKLSLELSYFKDNMKKNHLVPEKGTSGAKKNRQIFIGLKINGDECDIESEDEFDP